MYMGFYNIIESSCRTSGVYLDKLQNFVMYYQDMLLEAV